jgi:membrane protease YdiL (CAAX protease family)
VTESSGPSAAPGSPTAGSAVGSPRAWILVAAGTAALLLRTRLLALPDLPRAGALALVLGAILVACLLVPVPRATSRRLAPAAGLAIGLAAVGVATWVSGPLVHLPFSTWALPLSVLAAVAEEALFRRVAYAWLERWGAPVAVMGSAALFALMHAPLYGAAVFPVDLGAGLLFAWQRWATGTWTVPAATHSAANLLMTVMR